MERDIRIEWNDVMQERLSSPDNRPTSTTTNHMQK
jgi:hypothetical protein